MKATPVRCARPRDRGRLRCPSTSPASPAPLLSGVSRNRHDRPRMILNDPPLRGLSLSRPPTAPSRSDPLGMRLACFEVATARCRRTPPAPRRPWSVHSCGAPTAPSLVWLPRPTSRSSAPSCSLQSWSWPAPPLRRCHHCLIFAHWRLSIFRLPSQARLYLPLSSYSLPTHQLSGRETDRCRLVAAVADASS
jgi:hypothetical protein